MLLIVYIWVSGVFDYMFIHPFCLALEFTAAVNSVQDPALIHSG